MPTATGAVGSIAGGITAEFTINGITYLFRRGYLPHVRFACLNATLTYTNTSQLNGPASFQGTVGPSKIDIHFIDSTTTISGLLEIPTQDAVPVNGSGAWSAQASFDIFQQTFTLSMISNAVREQTGSQQQLQIALQEAVPVLLWKPSLATGWKVAWGPVVWKKEPDDANTGPDHAWFVAQHDSVMFEDGTSHKTYVVAIAGTARSSRYDWVDVSFNVNRVVDFAAWVAAGLTSTPSAAGSVDPAKSYISLGTAKGVHTILNTKAPVGGTLQDFIRQLPAASRLLFTGHSIGAAIAATAALALTESRTIDSSVVTHTYSTAGPSPGNDKFAASFAEKFPKIGASDGHRVWNCNIFNKRDIIPQHWCTDASLSPEQNVGNIEGIYGQPPARRLQSLVDLVTANVNGSGMAYIPLQGRSFDRPQPSSPPPTIDEFLKIARAEHMPETYTEFLEMGITPGRVPAEVMATALVGGCLSWDDCFVEALAEIEASGVAAGEDA